MGTGKTTSSKIMGVILLLWNVYNIYLFEIGIGRVEET